MAEEYKELSCLDWCTTMAQDYRGLNCGAGGAACDFIARSETEEEVIKSSLVHACLIHGMCKIPDEDKKQQVKKYMKRVPA